MLLSVGKGRRAAVLLPVPGAAPLKEPTLLNRRVAWVPA